MADHHPHHRPLRISLPPRTTVPITSASRPHPSFTYPPSTPTPTPSKDRLSSFSFLNKSTNKTSSLSFLFLLLFSLRSFYSLLPFLRSSPSSFSLFPFSFLVSLFSFVLTFLFSLFSSFSSFSSSKDPFLKKQSQPIFSLTLITQSQHRLLLAKSLLLAVIFLLRFQALRYCGAAAMILAEFSGNVAARFVAEGGNRDFVGIDRMGSSKVRGFCALFLGLFLLSISWDRIECFPLSSSNFNKFGLSVIPGESCVRIWPLLLPFSSGFLGCYERVSMNWANIRELGKKRARLLSLFFTTVVLFVPAAISMFVFESEGDSISFASLGWPLANTVVFGVLLSENYTDEKLASSKDFQREFIVTFVCTLILELFYFPELSLWGLLICGLLLWIALRELVPISLRYIDAVFESSESFTTSIMKPVCQILSERKSRKIALFLLINTAYMVVEFVAGFMSNSLGLISDACHMLFDCAALAIGLYASYISRLPANSQFNYGRGRFEVLSGYVNAVFLVLVGVLIVLESFERILDPQEISTGSLMAVSIGGLVVNVVGLIFFHEEHHHAHGGGSCSHSHSHLYSDDHCDSHHHHNSHDRTKHNDKVHSEHDFITVVHDCHEKSCSGQDDHRRSDHESRTCSHGPEDHDHGHHNGHHHHNVQHGDQHIHRSIPTGCSNSLYAHTHENHMDTHSHGHGEFASDRGKPRDVNKPREFHRQIDHNMEGIFLHVLADTMGSIGVVISTLLIKYKGWLVADPACSIFISILIVSSVIPLLRNSAEILLQRVPRMHEQDLKNALNDVLKIKGVCGIQNLHVWSFTNTDIVGTIHLYVSTEIDKAPAKAQVSHLLHNAGIKDLTVQVECIHGS